MDLVDEQDVTGAHVRERSHEIAGLFERGSGRRANVHAELARDQLRQRCLAKSGRADEERVVERLAAAERGVDVDAQAVLDLLLPDELRQSLRTEGELDGAFLGELFRGRDFAWGHRFYVAGGSANLTEETPRRPIGTNWGPSRISSFGCVAPSIHCGRGDAGVAPSAPNIELREVDRGVHSVSRTAMIAAMIAIATAG